MDTILVIEDNEEILENYRTGVSNSGRSNNRRSFNGPGGISARPSAQQETARNEKHLQPTTQQTSHVRTERNATESHSSLNEKSHATVAKKTTRGSHATQRTATTHAVNNTRSKRSNNPANTHLSESGPTREMNKTPRTNHRNMPSVTQSHNTQSRPPHVQQQHSMHAPAGRQEGGDKKTAGDRHN